jgi:hypothetical protein
VADVEIQYDPITVNSGPVTLQLNGLDNIKVDSKLAVTEPIETRSTLTLSVPEPVRTEAQLALSIPEPIRTEAKAAIDLQPVVFDQCLRFSLDALPPTLVCLPNRQRLGLTLFGVEVFGVTLEGEARLVVSDLPRPAHVVHAPSEVAGPAPRAPSVEIHPAERAGGQAHPAERARPFVVRVGG